MDNNSENTKYPLMSDRVKAYFIDSIFVIIFAMAISSFFESQESVSGIVRMIAFVLIFVLYDPLLTSFFGATLGHNMMNISVKQEDDIKKNIRLDKAIIRFVVKTLLGWFSLLTIHSDKKRKAIHDKVVGSVVIYN